MDTHKGQTATESTDNSAVQTKQDKVAISKALGQAFLSHQVRQLEQGADNQSKRQPRRNTKVIRDVANHNASIHEKAHNHFRGEEPSLQRGQTTNKEPMCVVVDASVLVHGLDQLRRWCSEQGERRFIIPLEALNTLDLLKKGNSPIATNARAASRFLEQQVGSNDKISVQGDTAMVHWPPTASTQDVPQWVQRTVCCALWEKAQSTDPVALAIVVDSNIGETTRWDSRIQGHLVHHWAAYFEIQILEVSKSTTRIRQDTKPQSRAPVEQRQYHNRRNRGSHSTPSHGPLVEKQPATVLPGSGVRLLARGEMLAP